METPFEFLAADDTPVYVQLRMESRNRLCRIFKRAARFVANIAAKRQQNGGNTATPNRKTLTEFGNHVRQPARTRRQQKKGRRGAPFRR
jgi:hypothetical protein